MVTKDKTQVKVGFFVVLGLLLGMYVIFKLGGENQLFQSRYDLIASFKDISGLRVGAPIQLAGLKVGYVGEIKFPQDLSQKDIIVTLKISEKYQERIRADSFGTIETQGLLGDKFINITIGSVDQPVLADHGALPSKDSSSLFTIAQKGGEVLNDVREAASSVKRVMSEVEKGNGLAHAIFFDPKGKEAFTDLAASLKALREMTASAGPNNKKDGEIREILKNMQAASKDIKEVAGKVNRGEGTIGGLLTDPSIYNDLRSLMGKANRNKLLKAVIRSTLAENDKVEK